MFPEPLIEVQRGGKAGGNARVTAAGETALGLYRQMEQESRTAIRASEDQMASLLRGPDSPE